MHRIWCEDWLLEGCGFSNRNTELRQLCVFVDGLQLNFMSGEQFMYWDVHGMIGRLTAGSLWLDWQEHSTTTNVTLYVLVDSLQLNFASGEWLTEVHTAWCKDWRLQGCGLSYRNTALKESLYALVDPGMPGGQHGSQLGLGQRNDYPRQGIRSHGKSVVSGHDHVEQTGMWWEMNHLVGSMGVEEECAGMGCLAHLFY